MSWIHPIPRRQICPAHLGDSCCFSSYFMLCVERKHIGLPNAINCSTHHHLPVFTTHTYHPGELSCTPEVVSVFIPTTAHPAAPDCCSPGFDEWAHPHVLLGFVGCILWQVSLLLKNRCEREKCFSMGRTPHVFHFHVFWNLRKVKRRMHVDYFHFIIPQCPLRGQE